MFRQLETRSYIFRLIVGIFVIIISILFLPFLISSPNNNNVEAQGLSLQYNGISDSLPDESNAVTAGFANIAHEAELTTYQIKDGAGKTTKSITSTTANIAFVITNNAQLITKTTINGAIRGVGFVGRTTVNSLLYIFRMPGGALNYINNTSLMKNIIRPSEYGSVQLIDPNSPELLNALATLPPKKEVDNHKPEDNNPRVKDSDSGPIWPINGRITTSFGVPHHPYQATHTGLDISDDQRSGVTSIKPFRSGKVIAVIHDKGGYGNHIIIDHGSGVTSLYAHLYSTSVSVGKYVTPKDSIGLEGSTGLSTGTHLHFEIRVNGKVADPRKFI